MTPAYGVINGFQSTKFYIPVRVLLGEMCLWAGRYQEAATYFSQYLTKKNDTKYTYTSKVYWPDNCTDFTISIPLSGIINAYLTSGNNDENVTLIPMETTEFHGEKSLLADIFTSTDNNFAYFQATPSVALRELSASQDYVQLQKTSDTQKDTVRVPKKGLGDPLYIGDLRLYENYRENIVNRNETSRYNTNIQYIMKLPDHFVCTYRMQEIYLLFAEALCRAGYPESAFCILKYGLRNQNIEKYVCQKERERAGSLINFNDNEFTEQNTQGIHARGCGNVECDTLYRLPLPERALASYEDTVQYQIPLVEDMIIQEKALEMSFEGRRYYDLMRIAMRRNDNSYLATPISKRNGTKNNALFNILMDNKNWYLPLK